MTYNRDFSDRDDHRIIPQADISDVIQPGTVWTVTGPTGEEREVYVIAALPGWAIVASVWSKRTWFRTVALDDPKDGRPTRYIDPARIGYRLYSNFICEADAEGLRPVADVVADIQDCLLGCLPAEARPALDRPRGADDAAFAVHRAALAVAKMMPDGLAKTVVQQALQAAEDALDRG